MPKSHPWLPITGRTIWRAAAYNRPLIYFSCLCSWYFPSVSPSPPHTFLFLPYPQVTTALYICCLAYQYLYLRSTCSRHRLSQQSRNSNFSELLKHITDTAGGYLYIALYCGCVSLECTSCKLHLCLPNCSTKVPCSRMWHFIPSVRVVLNELIIFKGSNIHKYFFKRYPVNLFLVYILLIYILSLSLQFHEERSFVLFCFLLRKETSVWLVVGSHNICSLN